MKIRKRNTTGWGLCFDDANLFHTQYKADWLILPLTYRHSIITIWWNLEKIPKQNLIHIKYFLTFYKFKNCIKTEFFNIIDHITTICVFKGFSPKWNFFWTINISHIAEILKFLKTRRCVIYEISKERIWL